MGAPSTTGERMQAIAGRADRDGTIPILRDLVERHRGVALVTSEGHLAWLSEPLAAWFDPNVVRCWNDLFSSERRGSELWDELLSQGHFDERQAELLTESGSRSVTLDAVRLAVGDDAGPVVAVVRQQDPTREPECARSRHYLAAVLEAAPEAALVLDAEGLVICANPAVEALLGYSPDSLVEQPISSIVERSEDADRVLAGLVCGERVRIDAVDLQARDGSAFQASVVLQRVHSPEGLDVGSVAHLRPAVAPGSAAFLERKNTELEHTLSAVSHDLRSPLVALLGFTRLVREDYGEIVGEKGRHFLQRIEQAAQTMETLIHDLLELSRIDPSKVNKSLVDPREVIRQLQSELKPRLDVTGTRLDVTEDMPLLSCDRTRLYQVLSNLVGNAIDHMGPVDEPWIQVAVATTQTDHRIVVRDNGRGVSPEHHDRIFEIFQSVGARGGERRGTGVGLAIVKKVAETHGGRAWVESTPGRGASFYVTLPR